MIRNRREYEFARESLEGNLNRMSVTDDMSELEDRLLYAELNLKQMFFYNKRRIEDEM